MIKNNQHRYTENKFLNHYIDLNDLGVRSDPYYEGKTHFFKKQNAKMDNF